MAEVRVGTRSDFEDDRRVITTVNDREVVVFRHGDRYYALAATCLHMGGPVGEGILIGKVEAVLDDQKRQLGERFSETEIHLVCPWHGYEYDIATGECAANRKLRLRTYEVAERDGDVYLSTDRG